MSARHPFAVAVGAQARQFGAVDCGDLAPLLSDLVAVFRQVDGPLAVGHQAHTELAPRTAG